MQEMFLEGRSTAPGAAWAATSAGASLLPPVAPLTLAVAAIGGVPLALYDGTDATEYEFRAGAAPSQPSPPRVSMMRDVIVTD